MDDDTDDGYDGDLDTAEPEDTTSRGDVEEAVIAQKTDKGHPDPHNENSGRPLRGRNDTAVGGRYEGLESFAAMARKNGTSIQQAVKDYHSVEQALQKDFPSGVALIAQRFGYDPRHVAAALHQTYFGPNGNQAMSQAAAAYQYQHHRSEIEAFRADPANKHFDAVRMDMARLVQAGRAQNLKQAYRLAIRSNPQLRVQEKIERSYGRH